MSFKSKYYQHDNRNLTILSYVRYNEISKNERKLNKNIFNYIRIEKNIFKYN